MTSTPQLPKPQTPTPKPSPKLKFSSKAIVGPVAALILISSNLVAGLLLINASGQNQIVLSHLEALRRNQQNVQKLENDLAAYSGKISQLQGILPKEKDVPQFIEFLNKVADSTNTTLALNFTSNQPDQTSSKLWAIPFRLQLTTTTKDLDSFLELSTSDKYQLRFIHLEVERSSAGDAINARIQGQLYVDSQFSES